MFPKELHLMQKSRIGIKDLNAAPLELLSLVFLAGPSCGAQKKASGKAESC